MRSTWTSLQAFSRKRAARRPRLRHLERHPHPSPAEGFSGNPTRMFRAGVHTKCQSPLAPGTPPLPGTLPHVTLEATYVLDAREAGESPALPRNGMHTGPGRLYGPGDFTGTTEARPREGFRGHRKLPVACEPGDRSSRSQPCRGSRRTGLPVRPSIPGSMRGGMRWAVPESPFFWP
jgi:hypothetical protein